MGDKSAIEIGSADRSCYNPIALTVKALLNCETFFFREEHGCMTDAREALEQSTASFRTSFLHAIKEWVFCNSSELGPRILLVIPLKESVGSPEVSSDFVH